MFYLVLQYVRKLKHYQLCSPKTRKQWGSGQWPTTGCCKVWSRMHVVHLQSSAACNTKGSQVRKLFVQSSVVKLLLSYLSPWGSQHRALLVVCVKEFICLIILCNTQYVYLYPCHSFPISSPVYLPRMISLYLSEYEQFCLFPLSPISFYSLPISTFTSSIWFYFPHLLLFSSFTIPSLPSYLQHLSRLRQPLYRSWELRETWRPNDFNFFFVAFDLDNRETNTLEGPPVHLVAEVALTRTVLWYSLSSLYHYLSTGVRYSMLSYQPIASATVESTATS